MRHSILILPVLLILANSLASQQVIDGTIAFQNDPAKKYSLYIPSSYEEGTDNPAILALHPLNTRRWDGESWRDTLITFAENNGLILVSPDGGSDGRIDDPIDTAFTSFLLDSVERAYSINKEEVYVIGFSWGGRTTYTYGLSNHQRFKGYIPIGAAITNLIEIGGVVTNAKDKPVYMIHGSNDSPATRFYPARQALMSSGACVNDTLMPGIGHTIDFPNRNEILSAAYQWLSQLPCGTTGSTEAFKVKDWSIPNPLYKGEVILPPNGIEILQIVDIHGKMYLCGDALDISSPGTYFISYMLEDQSVQTKKILVF
jgi:predicted esterase